MSLLTVEQRRSGDKAGMQHSGQHWCGCNAGSCCNSLLQYRLTASLCSHHALSKLPTDYQDPMARALLVRLPGTQVCAGLKAVKVTLPAVLVCE